MLACNNYPFEIEIAALVFYIIMIMAQSIIVYLAFYQLRLVRKKKKFKASLLQISSQYVFFSSSIAFYIGKILTFNCNCFYPTPSCNTSAISITFNSYAVHLLSLMLLFYSRLRDVFDGTAFQISRFLRYLLLICIIGLFILGIGGFSYSLVFGVSFDELLGRLAGIFFGMLILSQFLAWIFVYKLYKLHSRRTDDMDEGFIRFVRKYAVLSLICVMFTTLYAMIASIASINYSYYWSQILTVVIISDIFMDTFCTLLAFNYYDKQYMKLCGLCHYYCPVLLCLKRAQSMKETKLSDIVRITN